MPPSSLVVFPFRHVFGLPWDRFINNLNNAIHALAERNRGRDRYRNRNRERRRQMAFGHEKLDVDRAAIASIGWVDR